MTCPFGDQHSVPEEQAPGPVSRRAFIAEAVIGTTAAVSLLAGLPGCAASVAPPRTTHANRFTRNGKTALIAVEGTDISRMLDAGLNELDNLNPNWRPKSLTLKTNTDSADPYPINIEVALIRPLLERMKDSRTESIVVCDAPTTGMDKDRAFSGLGYFDLEKQPGVKVVGGDAGARSQFVSVRDDRWEASENVAVLRPLHEAPFIMNVAVPKRHVAARFTCALKNHFGSVYGPQRWVAHRKQREESGGKETFDKILVEFADAVRPELSIIDARSLLAKHGPKLRGKSEIKENVNKLILCGDMVAADAYCADLMKTYDETFDPEMISVQLEYAEKLGLGTSQKDKIEIIELVA